MNLTKSHSQEVLTSTIFQVLDQEYPGTRKKKYITNDKSPSPPPSLIRRPAGYRPEHLKSR